VYVWKKINKQKLSSHISPTYSFIDMKVMVYIFTVLTVILMQLYTQSLVYNYFIKFNCETSKFSPNVM